LAGGTNLYRWFFILSRKRQVSTLITDLIIVDALMKQQDKLILNPDLLIWQDALQRRQQQWFAVSEHNALSLYAAMVGSSPAQLLATAPHSTAQQYWVASPYHARMGRDNIRLMPESMLPWCAEDAREMCQLLNPWLKDEGMQLQSIGAALRLSCDRIWDVKPADFANISGAQLPNRHPQGEAGGRWMRLQSEIQMLLNQSPLKHRRQRAEADVHGLWFWGATSTQELVNQADKAKRPAVATRNAFLQSVVDAQDANIIITESETLPLLVRQADALPKRIFLLGAAEMVCLEPSLWGRFRKQDWRSHDLKTEAEGIQRLRYACK